MYLTVDIVIYRERESYTNSGSIISSSSSVGSSR